MSEGKTQELRDNLKKMISGSKIIDREDQDFWLAEIPNLPMEALISLLNRVQTANDKFDRFLETALAQDKNSESLGKIKEFIIKTRKEAYGLEEKAGAKRDADNLENLLKEAEKA